MNKDFIRLIEERERKNKEYKEKEKKKKEELEKKKEEQRKKKLEIEKERALKEEEIKKQKEEEKKRKKDQEEMEKVKQNEEKLKRLEADKVRREKLLSDFRKKNKIENINLTDNLDNKINYWDELSKKEERYKKIEEEKRKRLKKEILKNQYESRNKKESEPSTQYEVVKKEDIKKQKKTIEEMCILGDIIKKEIIEEKKENPEKYITIEEAVKTENKKDSPLFVLGMLAKNLENCGITTAIEKEELEEEKENDESGTSLQFLVNGLANKKKYDFHFDISEERNEELLNDLEEQEKFINNLRKKLSIEYKIPEDDIIITNPERGSFKLSVIFKNEDFDLDLDQVKEKFKDEPELIKLKDIQKNLLYTGCKLKKSMLDARGNNCDGGWGKNEKRGGEAYIPPEGWIGYGLNVLDRYDWEKGDEKNDWLSYDNRGGEWCVAYHGVGSEYSSKEVAKAVLGIATYTLKTKSELNNNNEEEDEYDYSEDDDMRHPGQKVGCGVYCSPNPEVMEKYAGIVEIDNEIYKMGFMLRVNPEKIRVPVGRPDFWVLNGNPDEVRPYRILIKKVEE